MRIATWNVERLKRIKEKDKILSEIEKVAADILVLTETDERLHPDYPFCYSTPLLKEIKPDLYKDTENRVSIFTKYKCVRELQTYDKYTAICVELETEYGNIAVYGTIMGIFGNRDKSYKTDLIKQMDDIKRLTDEGHRICVVGDYNMTFSDSYYYTKFGRETVQNRLEESHIFIMTSHKKECVDHIAVHDDFMYYGELDPSSVPKWELYRLDVTTAEEWNIDRTLSDHKGIFIDIQPSIPKPEPIDQDMFFEGTGLERYDMGYICYKGPNGNFYRMDHFSSFYVVESAENEKEARNNIFEDSGLLPDYYPLGERIFWVHEWLKKYAFE